MITNKINDRGVALIIVILMISVIVALTVQLSRTVRWSGYEALNASDGIKLYCVSKSGFYAGSVLLLKNKNAYDSLNDEWAQTEELSAKSESMFDYGSYKVYIEDESGKIPINKLVEGNHLNPAVQGLLIRFLSLPEFRLEQGQVHEIVNSLKDWLDTDDEVTDSGAETAYYSSLPRSYAAKNGPLDSLDELLLVKGISRELLYGSGGTPVLANYVSLSGSGKLNINTAPRLVLKALSADMTDATADTIDAYRRSPGALLDAPTWYKNVPGTTNVTIDSQLIVTKSDCFKITSVASFGTMKKKVAGVLRRSQDRKDLKLLSWKID